MMLMLRCSIGCRKHMTRIAEKLTRGSPTSSAADSGRKPIAVSARQRRLKYPPVPLSPTVRPPTASFNHSKEDQQMATNSPKRQVPKPKRSVIRWLLDSDPSIRWQAMRDLTDAPDEEVAAERAKVATEGWGAQILAGQRADGYWGAGTSNPEWVSLRALLLLRDMGLDPTR